MGDVIRTKRWRGGKGGGSTLRSDNLRPAPALFTPDFVKHMLALTEKVGRPTAAAAPFPTPKVKPTLKVSTSSPAAAVTPEPAVVPVAPEEPAKLPDDTGNRELAPLSKAAPARTSKRYPGASGTARKAPGAASSGAASRITDRAPIASEPAPAPVEEPARTTPAFRPLPAFIYAERIASARAYLNARHFTVRRDNPDDLIARWAVSGLHGFLSNEELVAFAQRQGMA
jgi:hypothetical protein